ncbi:MULTISPECIES: hypothetical protein [Streptomyces]|uniref:DUF305 domain-containing protein n=1 Tax=Streptomyces dengpaensis TaxID=2049881 RepID=A0ABM6T0K4_9ACTN|nr:MULTISPECIES: hypothetical protein [Streptomyces]AVH60517.1 hypothetical protein C4B68_37380 [Streptomyces dengpaensis]PIB07559.1 hypothetical protein B1C81_18670 [Streptomyces sp. HG99]
MSTAARLGLYAAALAVAFLAAFGIGRLAGPIGDGGSGGDEMPMDHDMGMSMGIAAPAAFITDWEAR